MQANKKVSRPDTTLARSSDYGTPVAINEVHEAIIPLTRVGGKAIRTGQLP